MLLAMAILKAFHFPVSLQGWGSQESLESIEAFIRVSWKMSWVLRIWGWINIPGSMTKYYFGATKIFSGKIFVLCLPNIKDSDWNVFEFNSIWPLSNLLSWQLQFWMFVCSAWNWPFYKRIIQILEFLACKWAGMNYDLVVMYKIN